MSGRGTHIVFSTGCTPYFDWQSLGLAFSHRHSQQPGRLTRLLSECADEAARARSASLPLMETHEHPDYGDPRVNGVNDAYAPYNKPGGVAHWLGTLTGAVGATSTTSDYVLPRSASQLSSTPALRVSTSASLPAPRGAPQGQNGQGQGPHGLNPRWK